MLEPKQLRHMIRRVIADKAEQGHEVDGLEQELDRLGDGFDVLYEFASRLSHLPLRSDWPYVEPNDLPAIRDESDPDRPTGVVADLGLEEASVRVREAFLGRVSGCMLGKPFEILVTLDELRSALEPHGEWPLTDYPTEGAVHSLPTLQGQWRELVRERISHVVPDDDINYSIIAMLLLEEHGIAFTQDHLRRLWLLNLPIAATFGPERTILLRSGLETLAEGRSEAHASASELNPGDELCGALIRADAYGYACLGRPELAAELAHRDASFTHQRTGIYGAMFVAAAIAASPAVRDPLELIRLALRYVPQRSRFAECVTTCLALVEQASDWLDGYQRIRARYGEYGHCRIYQEVGTLINTLRFAKDVGEGICIQVMQGNDTDSFGATAGSILGAYFGPGHLDARWLRPFNDDVHTALALFHERSLEAITRRMAALPARIGRDLDDR